MLFFKRKITRSTPSYFHLTQISYMLLKNKICLGFFFLICVFFFYFGLLKNHCHCNIKCISEG